MLGAPGSGKGTQSKLIVERYKLPQISTGDLLRDAVASGSTLGRQAKVAMDAGQLVSDEIVLAIIRARVIQPDAKKGFILDGFPRNLAQTEALDLLLAGLGQPVSLAMLIAVDVDALLQRLVGRRTCLSCGQMYNIYYAPPHIDGRCDACGGKLRHRADDNEEIIGNRLRVFETHTMPVLEYYEGQGKLRTIQGVGEISDIFKAVCKVVDEVKKSIGKVSRSDAIRRAIARQNVAPKTLKQKKAATKKKAATRKKTAVKKVSPKKKVVTRKKVAPKKKVTTKKKVVSKKKVVPKKKSVQKKKVVPKKKAVRKKAAKKKARAKKKR
jgi:adenylate kinase